MYYGYKFMLEWISLIGVIGKYLKNNNVINLNNFLYYFINL